MPKFYPVHGKLVILGVRIYAHHLVYTLFPNMYHVANKFIFRRNSPKSRLARILTLSGVGFNFLKYTFLYYQL